MIWICGKIISDVLFIPAGAVLCSCWKHRILNTPILMPDRNIALYIAIIEYFIILNWNFIIFFGTFR